MLSFSIVDTFLDKLFPIRGKESSLMKFPIAQNFMSNGNDVYQSAIHQYQRELIETDWIVPDSVESQTSNVDALLNSIFSRMLGNNVPRHFPKLAFSPHLSTLAQSRLRLMFDPSEVFDYLSSSNLCSSILFDETPNPAVEKQKCDKNISDATDSSCTGVNHWTESISISISEGKEMQNSGSFVLHLAETAVTNNQIKMSEKHYNLNVELANRKAKELQRRSKKRRRRQKKIHHMNSRQEYHKSHMCSLESQLSHKAEVCRIDVSLSSSNFSNPIVPEGIGNSLSPSSRAVNSKEKVDFVLDVVHMEGSSTDIEVLLPTNLSSFVISVASTSDEDSDWDASADDNWLPETNEFELSGLFVANLNTSKTDHNSRESVSLCSVVAVRPDDLDELNKLQAVLCEVNKNWEEATKDIDYKPKLPTKVSFAPDDELVEVMPVEMYERKGEWEIYATERARFKRRIRELENVLSPCLSNAHRLKMYHQLYQSEL